ncbi:MAG TPA: hypothetical protein DIT47_08045 [Flavobacteriaceae bacterium]|nr:hypothetical protein [Flavobacteriaceae bacterium]
MPPKNNQIEKLKERLAKSEDKLKLLNEKLKVRTERPTLQISKNEIVLKKSHHKPNFTSKTILTDSTWNYVEIYLRQFKTKESEEALFYWDQAKNFYEASKSLSIVSSPLTIYYCFLNATKALLRFKGQNFNLKHGVTGKRKDGQYVLQNETLTIKAKGVLSGLCAYLGEPIKNDEPAHSLKDIFYNLSFIHRAFQLTFSSPSYPELFVPIINPRYVFDKFRKVGWFEAQLECEHSNNRTNNNLIGFGLDKNYENKTNYVIRRNKTFKWDCFRNKPTEDSLIALNKYHFKIRKQLRTIYGPNNLWYIKRTNLSTHIIDRSNLVLIFATMHRLSEMARYEPQSLLKHLEKNHSWLLTEFINKSPLQFIDEISSEITGNDFRATGFRE